MLLPQEVNEKGGGDNEGDEHRFSWGRKTGVQYYLSFTYNGVHYSLYDCVYMRCDDEPETGIGKLVKMFETANGIRKVKVVWFFRPAMVQKWLGDIRILPNELFLASGEGKGVFSLNPLENICGKCSVICISKDRRNPQPTEEESRKAKYVFFRAFDVKTRTISKIFPDVIAEVEVKNYFNQRKDSKLHPAKGAGLETKLNLYHQL
nr:protein ANTI-SILENCING 1-like isoform X1 [Ipomoea batatas]